MAIGKKTGGRKKGTPNKASAARAEEIAASGLTPLDFMLQVLRDESNPQDVRLDAASKAAPFVHPKLAAIEHSGGMTLTHEEALDELDEPGA
jgi:hypothetical protein